MIEEAVDAWTEPQLMMTNLPIGSYLKVLETSFAIVLPLNGITGLYKSKTTIVFEAKTIGMAYDDALNFICHLGGVIDREREG